MRARGFVNGRVNMNSGGSKIQSPVGAFFCEGGPSLVVFYSPLVPVYIVNLKLDPTFHRVKADLHALRTSRVQMDVKGRHR